MSADLPRARATAARVIREEAQGLSALADALGEGFDEAVEAILSARGRVIVSGMGKSGHVARKIAATLASTGTPAHFVHPAEASHGDLGMMLKGDVVLVLSNSGETPELADLVAHTRRFGIPLIAVAGRADSSLMRRADIGLLLPQVPEACGIGVVPTTSTAMMLALGDALAIALMEARDFSPANFRDFHPGGRLGARLTRVRDLMHGGDALPLVRAPTLLIVGGNDVPVIGMNTEALERLRAEKRLEVVAGATHLFEEPGALEEVARLAAAWFARYLAPEARVG